MNAFDKHFFHKENPDGASSGWSVMRLVHFWTAATKSETAGFNNHYDTLLKSIVRAAASAGSLDNAEPDVRKAFAKFLKSQKYEFALRNFEKLLEEKSGSAFKRSDGGVNWFHELVPVMTIMGMVRNGFIELDAMNRYGGLETAITTHLRHDSVEDVFKYDQQAFNTQLEEILKDIVRRVPGYDAAKGTNLVRQTGINVGLITQKRVRDMETGENVKEDTIDYTQRMVHSDEANPVVFLSKQTDTVHNFATMWAPKFTPERRQRRCDDREDMYGSRHGFTDAAMEKWPSFTKAIKAMDDMMGVMLYTHFRYLESVDLYYKRPSDNPIGMGRYINGAMSLDLPKPVNLIHIFMNNLAGSVDKTDDPDKFARLQHFIQVNVRPAFSGHLHRFGNLFKKAGNGEGAPPPPVAF